MSFDSQSDLQTAVANWLNRSDLTALIPDFIELCEARLRRDESTRTVTRTTLTLDTSPVTLPSDFRSCLALFYRTDPYYDPIELTTLERVSDYTARFGPTGQPKVASILYDPLELHLGPTPDQSYTAQFVYDAGMDSTYLLTHFPDVYLYGSLVEASPYLRDDGRVPLWEQRFQQSLETLRRYNVRAQWNGPLGPMRPKIALGEDMY